MTEIVPVRGQLAEAEDVIDWSGRFIDWSPSDAWQYFKQEIDLETIAKNFHRLLDAFTTPTIEERLGGFVVLPAMLGSYILPVYFVTSIVKRFGLKWSLVLSGDEQRYRKFWEIYLFVGGMVMVIIDPRDRFVVAQGSWELFCGVVVFVVGPSWWGKLSAPDAETTS